MKKRYKFVINKYKLLSDNKYRMASKKKSNPMKIKSPSKLYIYYKNLYNLYFF